jgi:phospholipase C
VWIWMENKSYRQVIGSPAAPYATALARQCGTASAYHTVGSPSLPNYLGATSGDTGGINDDGGPDVHPQTGDNLFRQVRARGATARSYVESMPTNCAVASRGRYAVKHNPAAYYTSADDRRACVTDDVPLGGVSDGALAADLAGDRLPTFSFVVPDLCDDGHDCPVTAADAWLTAWLPRILTSAAYRSGTTAVFVVWDEYTPVPNMVISPTTPPGTTSNVIINHYSLLRTTEELLGVPLLGHAATAPSMGAVFHLE